MQDKYLVTCQAGGSMFAIPKTSKYKTLSLSSILTERCRESHVVDMLRANNDSTIHPADQPPYIILTQQ